MSKELDVVIKVAKSCGKFLLKKFGKASVKRKNKGFELVTDADIESEKIIIKELSNKFPTYSILAEETGLLNKHSRFQWIIDPLDGTHNYIYGFPNFSVSIALAKNQKFQLGVIYLPYFNDIYFAERGLGAFLNDKRIKVSEIKDLGKSILFYECEFFYQRRKIISLLNILSKEVFSIRVSGSVTNDLTSLSCGRAQVAIHFSVKPADFAAGAIILEEAGGKITDLSGKKLSLNSKNILSTNRKLHNAILKAIR